MASRSPCRKRYLGRSSRAALAILVSGLVQLAPTLADNDTYSPGAQPAIPRTVYWGDTHLHTRNSFDAYNLGNIDLGPEDAYRFARGEQINSQTGLPARLRRPLDFLVVADHAEYLGAFQRFARGDAAVIESAAGRRWSAMATAAERFADAVKSIREPGHLAPLPESTQRAIWLEDVVRVADRHNAPGAFTAFAGYEWTAMKDGNNLHRVVVFRDGEDKTARALPFSAADSVDPEDLWRALADYERDTGGEALAIAHNGNLSNGLMFADTTLAGEPLTRDYALMRARYEPLYEVTQVKGDGETHPALSPNDEFADYETWDYGNIAMTADKEAWMLPHEYARGALKLGLRLAARLGANPFSFGMIGSTDSHTSLATAAEDNFFGKFPESEPGPQRLRNQMAGSMWENWRIAASGYAGVWATANTRQALFDAMRRREVYATTGSRITLRFFGGWDFEPADLQRPDWVGEGYRRGVPMGGDLETAAAGRAPTFLVAATKDPLGANLDRIQIIKGWLDRDGELREKVYDVAFGAGRARDAETGRLRPVGNTVDSTGATYRNSIGEALLSARWQDPAFDPGQRAFYYARVIEIPTPRWPVYDARAFGFELPPDVPTINQERAYSSPIWYTR